MSSDEDVSARRFREERSKVNISVVCVIEYQNPFSSVLRKPIENHIDIRVRNTGVTRDTRKASCNGSLGTSIDDILYGESESISVS